VADPSLDARIKLVDDVRWCRVDGEVVMLHLGTGQSHGLNPSAAAALEAMAAGATPRTAAADVARAANADPERVRGDVAELVRALRDRNLIVVDDHPA
jgi:hypothetical protein